MIPNPSLSVLNKKIAFSTLVQYVGKGIQMMLGIVTLKLISNFLNQHDYGTYGAITEYALFFSVVANLGIFGNLVRKMADNPTDSKTFMNALLLRVISALLFFAGGFVWIAIGQSDSVFLVGTALFFGALFFDYITSVCDAALQAQYHMGRATAALVMGRIIFCLAVVAITKAPFAWLAGESGVIFVFAATLLASFLTAGLSLYFVSQKVKLRWHFDRHFMIEILKISLPFGIINIFNNLYFRFLPDYFAYNGLTKEAFATWNISFKIAQVLSLFSTFLMFSVLPGLKEYIDRKEWSRVQILSQKIWKILLAAGLALFVFGSLLGPFVIELLTHKKYFLPEFWFVLPLMLLLAGISYSYDFILITLFALEKERWLLQRECVALGLALVLFTVSWFIPAQFIAIKLLLLLAGAIAGEGFMVLSGLIKIKMLLKQSVSGAQQ